MFPPLPTVIALVICLMAFFAVKSGAQEVASWPDSIAVEPTTASFGGSSPRLLTTEQIRRALPTPTYRSKQPPTVLTSLYASTAVMQALDVHSTLAAFRAGAREVNPLMQGVTKNRALFVAVKAGVAVSTMVAAKQLSRRNKAAAIATLIAVNTATAVVVRHNYKVARRAN